MPEKPPPLTPDMRVEDFEAYYYLKDDLVAFARRLDLPTRGAKPALRERIARRLRGLPDEAPPKRSRPRGPRDSDQPLRRDTPVVHYKSDAATRAFFKAEIGPEFHFTYHLNQWRLARAGLTYGDLVDEWLAERDRRSDPDYRAPLAAHGEYNLFVRAFFDDPTNRGKLLSDAAAAWNAVKPRRGPRRYRR